MELMENTMKILKVTMEILQLMKTGSSGLELMSGKIEISFEFGNLIFLLLLLRVIRLSGLGFVWIFRIIYRLIVAFAEINF